MAITSEKNRTDELTTDGVIEEFDFDFLVHSASEVQAWYAPTGGSYDVLVLSTDYSVVFTEDGGTVSTSGYRVPLAAGKLLIIRHLELTQETNWLYNDNHTEQQHQDDFDRSVIRDIQQQEEIDRCPKFLTHSSTKDITFPEPVANMILAYNAAGDNLSLISGSAFAAGVPEVINDLTDVSLGAPLSGDLLRYDGSFWVNDPYTNIDHLNITNVGTNTHAQIDTHIALVNEHLDWTNETNALLTTGSGTFSKVLVGDGVVGAPSLAFSSNTDRGMWTDPDKDEISFSIGGARVFRVEDGSIAIKDADSTYLARLKFTGTALTALRNLNIDLNNASRTIDLTGNATLNQDVSSSASPTFVKLTISELLLDFDTRDYLFTNRAEAILAIQCQQAGNSFLELYTSTGDGTERAGINIFGQGTPASITDAEYSQWATDNTKFFICTAKAGTGDLLPLHLYTGDHTTQLVLSADDDSISMSGDLGVTGDITTNDLIIGDGRYIGSASDTDAIQIEADGDVVLTQDLTVAGTVSGATNSTFGNLTLADGSITDSGGAISFGNENLSTTGTFGAGAITGTSLITGGDIGIAADTDLLQLAADALTVNGAIGATTTIVSPLIVGTSFVTGGNIGVSGDTDLLQLAANALTVNGTIVGAGLTSTDLITINQSADSDGLQINGFDDHSGLWFKLHIQSDGAGIWDSKDNFYIKRDGVSAVQFSSTGLFVYKDLNVLSGILRLTETTTPAASAGKGKLYTQNDNLLYFQSGDGVEHQVAYAEAIYAQLSDSTDQTFGATGTAQSITFNTNDEIAGITHSTSSNPENITIITTGVYNIVVQPQVHAGSGASNDYFHMWLQKHAGEAFADIPNSNVELTLSTNDEDVILLNAIVSLNAGDIIRVRSSVGHTNIELDAQTPGSEPAIPSIIFSMFMIGT